MEKPSPQLIAIIEEMNSFLVCTEVCTNCAINIPDGGIVILNIPFTMKKVFYDTIAVFVCAECTGHVDQDNILDNLDYLLTFGKVSTLKKIDQ